MRRFFCLCLLFVSLTAWAQVSACLPTQQEKPFRSGEQFIMSIMFKWGAVNPEVAKVSVSLDSLQYMGKPSYHTALKVKSASFFDAFFKMREHFQSWFDASTIRPYKFSRDTQEGNYTATNLYLYDWEAGKIHADVEFDGKDPKTLEIPLRDGVYDLPSLIYYVRSLDYSKFRKGQVMTLTFAIDDDVYDVRLTYYGSERIKVRKMGQVQAHRFSCSVVSGAMFEGNQELQFWMSDDKNRIPVAIKVPLRFGAVQCWLTNTSNLKYPFTALKK